MRASKAMQNSAQGVAGLAMLVMIVIGVIAYFSTSVSTKSFVTVAFLLTLLVVLMSFLGWIRVRMAGLFVAAAIVLMVGVMYGNQPSPKSGQFQAVFLTNGQVYFGHLKDANTKDPILTDIYYLQSQTAQPNSSSTTSKTSNSQLSLVKLGNELHGPEDQMNMKSDQILFWENLKDSSKVVQAIKNNK